MCVKLREKTRFIIQAELAEVQTRSRYKATIANFHAQLLTCCTALLRAAKVALMGFSFHFSFGGEAYGHSNGVWPDAFGCISAAGISARRFWRRA